MRSAGLQLHGVDYIDVGTSGGIAGFERGFCLMVGGGARCFERLRPIFAALAPGAAAAPRTPGRRGGVGTVEEGFLHCGPHGAGHFVNMVHNGIDYGLMAAYGEGLNILRNANMDREGEASDAGIAGGAGRTSTNTISTSCRSPRSGVAAASWAGGFWTRPRRNFRGARFSKVSPNACPILVTADERLKLPSRRVFPFPFSVPRFSTGSLHAGTRSSPTAFPLPCAMASVVT